MAWYEMNAGGIPASLKSDMNSVLNKKFGTVSQDYPPNGWPSDVNLLGPLPEKTVSGAIASFSDGADDVPTKSLIVTIPASLSGVSSVIETQTGRNLLDITDIYGEGYYNTSGTWSASSSYNCYSIDCKPSTTYTISGNFAEIITYWKADGTFISGANQGSGFSKTFTTPTDCYIFRRSILKTNIDGTQMLEVGSTAHTYEPYTTPTTYTASLGRTIYGGEVDIVNGEGQETHQEIDLGSLTWVYASASNRFYANLHLSGIYTNFPTNANELADITCADYETITFSSLSGDSSQNNKVAGITTDAPFITIRDTRFSNATDFKNAVTGKKAVIPLATPTDFTFTGQEIPTRLGYNAFWSDEGDTEVTYRQDIDLALNA